VAASPRLPAWLSGALRLPGRLAGGLLGPVGLAFEELATFVLRGGRPMESWDSAREILAGFLPELDLETVRVRHRARLAIPRRYRAITLGSGIYARPALEASRLEDLELLLHELVHVRQYRRLSRLGFAWVYGAEIGAVGYRRNALETEAREFVRRHQAELRERHRGYQGSP
jgi:hypothetical protein